MEGAPVVCFLLYSIRSWDHQELSHGFSRASVKCTSKSLKSLKLLGSFHRLLGFDIEHTIGCERHHRGYVNELTVENETHSSRSYGAGGTGGRKLFRSNPQSTRPSPHCMMWRKNGTGVSIESLFIDMRKLTAFFLREARNRKQGHLRRNLLLVEGDSKFHPLHKEQRR